MEAILIILLVDIILWVISWNPSRPAYAAMIPGSGIYYAIRKLIR